MRTTLFTCCLALAACSGDTEPVGLDVLGAGSHDLAMVNIEVLATAADGLNTPVDVAFNTRSPDQLWVVTYQDDSLTRLDGADYSNAWTSGSPGSEHFMRRPMSMAFSDFGNFATAQDTDELTQGNLTPEDFMGPTLWDDSDRFDGGHGGHLDMLHNSPLGGGIAWETGNAYWYFDGYNSSITRYDFVDDHGYGGAYHGDGIIRRHVEGEVSRTEGVPSHLEYDASTQLLYIADTNNGRIAVLDTTTGRDGAFVGPNYDGADQARAEGTEMSTLVNGDVLFLVEDEDGEPTIQDTNLSAPSGLALSGGYVWVTDNDNSRILAFDMSGLLVDWIELNRPAGSLGGIDVDAEGRLYVADMVAEEVLRISAAPVVE